MPEDVLEFTGEDLSSLKEIERFAPGDARPKSWTGSLKECAAKILLTLARKTYPPGKAEKLWQTIPTLH